MLESITPRWQSCIVAAPGPSLPLTVDDAKASGLPVLVVQDAWRLMPWADVLYGCDGTWWDHHNGTEFQGEKWSSHSLNDGHCNDKLDAARKYGLKLVRGVDAPGFSLDPRHIHYGQNSGFQAVNLAILFGATHIVLIGFDMQMTDGKAHFFGDHPKPLTTRSPYDVFIREFERAAKMLPAHIKIYNATPTTALTCFPKGPLI